MNCHTAEMSKITVIFKIELLFTYLNRKEEEENDDDDFKLMEPNEKCDATSLCNSKIITTILLYLVEFIKNLIKRKNNYMKNKIEIVYFVERRWRGRSVTLPLYFDFLFLHLQI